MPSYVIMHASKRIGETIEATLCDPSITGVPDRRTGVPVRVRLVSEHVLSVDDERDHLERGATAKTCKPHAFGA
jgi:hypothetical protein